MNRYELHAGHSQLRGWDISSRRVARIVEAKRGEPRMIVSDHGNEFTCNPMLAWSKDTVIQWDFIGKRRAEAVRR